jgi:(p)ppGpp synthase/HD superfamily hydrolase
MKTNILELKEALQIARKAHEGQLRAIGRDIGQPYFDTHVLRVVDGVPQFAKPAAALHDVLEDTPMTIQKLRAVTALSDMTLGAVDLLTRKDGETYQAYIDGIVSDVGTAGKIARAVKLADLMDNLTTLPTGSLRSRYIKAIEAISKSINANSEYEV